MSFAEITVLGIINSVVVMFPAFATFIDEGSTTSKDPSKEATTA